MLVAIVVAAVVAGVVAGRLQRMAKRTRPEPGSSAPPVVADTSLPLSTGDQRFRLLSFQGGSVPADLGPMLEELRRNGIEVDEETLRRKLDGGVAEGTEDATAEPETARTADGSATATVVEVIDVPVGNPAPGRMAVRVTLELRLLGREPIREQVVAVVAEGNRALLVEGAEVPVRYDPDGPSVITLAWALA